MQVEQLAARMVDRVSSAAAAMAFWQWKWFGHEDLRKKVRQQNIHDIQVMYISEQTGSGLLL
jgi:hypothetical protein